MKYVPYFERKAIVKVPPSRTIKTRCRYCGAEVYFYTNEHGSKVFFDELGPPWPIHSCPEYEAHLAATQTHTGPVGRFVPVGDELLHESEYAARILAGAAKRKHWRPPIIAVQPQEGQEGSRVKDFGVLRELILDVNLHKKLGIEKETAVTRKIFGRFLEVDWAQVSIHVDDLAEDEIESYTMLIEKERLVRLNPKKGCIVSFAAEAVSVPFRNPLWVCKEINIEVA